MDEHIIKSQFIAEKLNYHSLSELFFDRLKHNSQHICVIDCTTGQTWTRRQVLDSSLNFAYYLINDCKLCKGDVVFFVAKRSAIHIIAVFGVFMAGGVYCFLEDQSTEPEIQSTFETIKPSIVVCIESKYEFIKTLSKESLIKKILFIGETMNAQNECQSIESIFTIERNADIDMPVKTNPDDRVSLPMTSGSTGRPKVIIKTNAMELATIEVILHREICPMTSDTIVLGDKLVLGAIAGGAQVAIGDSTLSFDERVRLRHKYRVSDAFLIPTHLNYLVKNYDKLKPYLKSLKNVLAGGAPISGSTHEFLVNNCAFKVYRICYGLTEVAWATQVPVSESKHKANCLTVGKVCPNTEIKVIDEMGNSLPANKTGEICIRGGQVTHGYLNDSDANAKLFTSDGFLKSGDIGYYDEKYDFFIKGRIKDVIIVYGQKISLSELENILVSNEHVVNASVIGVSDEHFGEVPMAFVTVQGEVSAEELIEYVNSRVNYFKQLRGGLKIVTAFPSTPLGKINKRKLKECIEK